MNNGVITAFQAENTFLSAVYEWGIDVIRVIQSIQSPLLTAIMKGISSLGSENFYIIIVLILFWCWNEKKGFYLGLLIIVSGWINGYCFVTDLHVELWSCIEMVNRWLVLRKR